MFCGLRASTLPATRTDRVLRSTCFRQANIGRADRLPQSEPADMAGLYDPAMTQRRAKFLCGRQRHAVRAPRIWQPAQDGSIEGLPPWPVEAKAIDQERGVSC